MVNLKGTIEKMRRIFLIANKPDKQEYKQSVKITGLGFVVIGVIGFAIFIVVQLLGGL